MHLGLVARIALLVVGVEFAAFSLLGAFYIERFGSAVDERTRSRLQLVGRMIASDELAVHVLSRKALIGEMVGALYLSGMGIGGNGRVIVATDPRYLGQPAAEVPDFDPAWIADGAPREQFIVRGETLTGVTHIFGAHGGGPLYYTVITIGIAELAAEKRSIALWGGLGSLLFILLSSAAIILIAQRFIARRVDSSLAVIKEVEGGVLDARIPVTSEDELGQLQHGINSMTTQLASLLVQHRRNEEELGAILNGIGDGVIAVSPDGTILRCNPSAATVLGIDPEDCAWGPVVEVLPELATEGKGEWWRSPQSLTASRRLSIGRHGAQGTQRAIELGHWPILDPDGEVSGAVLVLQDVTERRLAEERLRATTRLIDSIVENIPNMIFLKGAEDLRFVLFNRAGEELLGMARGELLGKNDHDFFPQEQADFFTEKDRQVLSSRTVLDIPEEVITTRSGERILHTKKLTLFDDEGRPEYLLGISEDITELKHTSEELERHRHHLEQLVAERTTELSSAKEAAEAANRAKSIFLANMSHELRTPLNAILGFAQLMGRDKRIPPEERRNLNTINRAGNHLLSLINDVLEITRIEAGRTTVEEESFDLAETLLAVEEMVRARAEGKGLELVIERHPKLPTYARGDAHHLRQVLINLLGNAVKYTEEGKIHLRIIPLDDTRVRFEVADMGPGIAPEEQEQVFHPFYQTASGVAKGEGTGLGLTISREFVRLMGGELEVESVPGRGSTFRFTIPLPSAPRPAEEGHHGRVVGIESEQRRWRILVVEDHPDSRDFITCLLEGVGFEVATAENGQLALERFASSRPDLIWMDMRMPVMDGYEVTRRIRALPGGRDVKIVALTASAFKEDSGAILAAGCDDVVCKPIEEDRLFAVMARLLPMHFRYKEEPAAPASAPGLEIDLSALPQPIRDELAECALRLDPEATTVVTERLRAKYPREVEMILALVENFDYRQLWRQCTR